MSRILPILFNTDMVRAILDGRKTVTRRIIKPQPIMNICYTIMGYGVGKWSYPSKSTWQYWGEMYKRPDTFSDRDEEMIWNPPCHTDDILYIRETWSRLSVKRNAGYTSERYVYKASDIYPFGEKYIVKFRWRPSIHMPKEAARIWLKVTDVRVERLQDITIAEIIKEGCAELWIDAARPMKLIDVAGNKNEFTDLWNSTIKKSDLDRYGWSANPWVWVIEFERCDKPEREDR